MTEFVVAAGLVDNRTLKLSDVDLAFIATCSASVELKGHPRKPERAMVRFQWVEFLVRLAEDKYVKGGVCRTVAEAVRTLLGHC